MNVHFSYRLHRTPDIDHEIQHWAEKVQRRLQLFRPELVHLKGAVEQNSAREGIVVSLNLRLPSGQMAAHESAETAAAAIKSAFNDLLVQIGKHKQQLRRTHDWRRRTPEQRPVSQIPFEETAAALPLTATSEDVRSYVNANFRRLQLFVEREIQFRESSGDLYPDSVCAEEVVDQAVADALDDVVEKPDRIGIQPWFYRLAIRAMNDFAARRAQGSGEIELHAKRAPREERASDEEALQFHQPDETVTNESSIADRGAANPEEIAYTDEMVALVQHALKGAAPEDRETFVLHALEGFSVEEIAAITDRNRSQVEFSIVRARQRLRQSFAVNNPFSKVLPSTGTR